MLLLEQSKIAGDKQYFTSSLQVIGYSFQLAIMTPHWF